ncbi:MAG: DUF2892 domain-containing protein [Deltaproteobacteria bacterium]|jgi:hypothetical protein|nr:DUF2892 domain-containing protein [Deltaproteobacteria bacterium]
MLRPGKAEAIFIQTLKTWSFGQGFVSFFCNLFTGFVGLNFLQSSFTGFCPLAVILKKVGVRTGHAFS